MQQISLFDRLESVILSAKQEPIDRKIALERISALWDENREEFGQAEILLRAFEEDIELLVKHNLCVGAARRAETCFRLLFELSALSPQDEPEIAFCAIDPDHPTRRLYAIVDAPVKKKGCGFREFPWEGWCGKPLPRASLVEGLFSRTIFFQIFDCYTGCFLYFKGFEKPLGDPTIRSDCRSAKVLADLGNLNPLTASCHPKAMKAILHPRVIIRGVNPLGDIVDWKVNKIYFKCTLWSCCFSSERPPPTWLKVEFFAQMLLGLSYIHKAGSVHGGLSLENCLIHISAKTATYSLKLAGSSFVRAGTLEPRRFGPITYLAPEGYDTRLKVAPARDLWAAGIASCFLFGLEVDHVQQLLTCLSRWRPKRDAVDNAAVVADIVHEICNDLPQSSLGMLTRRFLVRHPPDRIEAERALEALRTIQNRDKM